MKGISNIIAIILILLITVSLAGLAYIFFTGVAFDLFSTAGNQTQQLGESFGARLKIESINNEVVFIRNIGQTKLTDFFVSVNDFPVQFIANPVELNAGEIGNISLIAAVMGVKPTDNTIKVTTAQGASTTEMISGFTGKVTRSGSPVASATVNIISNGNILETTTTSSTGDYVVYVSPGTYDIQVSEGGTTETVEDQSIARGQIRTIDITLGGGAPAPGPTTYELFVYGRGYTCNSPYASHTIAVNNIIRFTFDPCATFGTTLNWVSFVVTDYVTQGTNSFDIRDSYTGWTNSNLAIGIDSDTPDGNSDIQENYVQIAGELMIYINACNNLGCTQYRSDDNEYDRQVGIDYSDDYAIKRISLP